jgi:hypothetical protein
MSYSNCPSSSDTVNLADRGRDEVALVTQLRDAILSRIPDSELLPKLPSRRLNTIK